VSNPASKEVKVVFVISEDGVFAGRFPVSSCTEDEKQPVNSTHINKISIFFIRITGVIIS